MASRGRKTPVKKAVSLEMIEKRLKEIEGHLDEQARYTRRVVLFALVVFSVSIITLILEPVLGNPTVRFLFALALVLIWLGFVLVLRK